MSEQQPADQRAKTRLAGIQEAQKPYARLNSTIAGG